MFLANLLGGLLGGSRPRRRGGARMYKKGAGFMDFLSKANSFAKDNKIVSRLAGGLGGLLPGKYGQIAQSIASGADKLGYGRRRRGGRRYRGGAIRLAGGAGGRRRLL